MSSLPPSECRICYAKASDTLPLISPCLCKGTQKFVHNCCVVRFHHVNHRNPLCCPICKYVYRLEDNEAATGLRRYLSSKFVRLGGYYITVSIGAKAIGILGFNALARSSLSLKWKFIIGIPSFFTFGIVNYIVCLTVRIVIQQWFIDDVKREIKRTVKKLILADIENKKKTHLSETVLNLSKWFYRNKRRIALGVSGGVLVWKCVRLFQDVL
ncbi:hypothetical protein L596_021763 [Steinernema carpocapsae]|uniref:Uncharacterized protein n=1 Tax=Steinernema carpocapsae TaxID=34508 RepID=A0A4U5MJR0_STECR|nr:hypothetical protein L596_021763 [Steinernema carpocapsae]